MTHLYSSHCGINRMHWSSQIWWSSLHQWIPGCFGPWHQYVCSCLRLYVNNCINIHMTPVKFYSFLLSINIMDGCHLSNKVYYEHLPIKTKVIAIQCVASGRCFKSCTLVTRQSASVIRVNRHNRSKTFKGKLGSSFTDKNRQHLTCCCVFVPYESLAMSPSCNFFLRNCIFTILTDLQLCSTWCCDGKHQHICVNDRLDRWELVPWTYFLVQSR